LPGRSAKREGPGALHAVGHADIGDGFTLAAHDPMQSEPPGTIRRVLGIHLRETLGTDDALI
jgi:hypothetical protein